MRNVLLLASMLFATGCPGFCGGFSGSDATVYQRGSESLILCGNGGFVANLSTGSIEGKRIGDDAVRGDDGSFAFQLQINADGTATTPELEGGAWTEAMLDATALDHADVQCQDLETRAWWTAQ